MILIGNEIDTSVGIYLISNVLPNELVIHNIHVHITYIMIFVIGDR